MSKTLLVSLGIGIASTFIGQWLYAQYLKNATTA
jgi:hypothetical protein